MRKTKFYSWANGELAKGCKQCVKGEKLVLFITGLCPRRCYYCPISDRKYGKDVVYANEMPIRYVKEAIEEAKLCDAKGAGITGGDPLTRLERTLKYIKALKKKFGKKFHIHLYTSFDLADDKNLNKLYDAGLDEIRFHADIDNDKLWGRIENALKFKWAVGIEIPVIPGKLRETKKLIDYFEGKVDFINLNELEVADNKISKLSKLGFLKKNRLSYAVKGSEEMALRLLKHAKGTNLHFCTAKLKDKVQLGERIKKRAKNIAKKYDLVDEEGILIRGAIYCRNPVKVRKELMKEFDIPAELIEIDNKRGRLLTGAWIIDEIKEELKARRLKIAIVEEYPTWDRLQLTVNYI
jgi:hypothetical protein